MTEVINGNTKKYKNRRRKVQQKPLPTIIPESLVEKLPQPPRLEPAAPPLSFKVTKSVILAAFQQEDKKYDLNFDVPQTNWPKEDQNKMRVIMREESIAYKQLADKYRIRELQKKYGNSSLIEKTLVREVMGLYQKDFNLSKYMALRDVAFSTFSKRVYDWKIISEKLDKKYSPAECEEYWFMVLYPRLKNTKFNRDSNAKLMELAEQNKFRNWDKISEKMLGRTEYQCYVHFRRDLYSLMEGWHVEENDGKGKNKNQSK